MTGTVLTRAGAIAAFLSFAFVAGAPASMAAGSVAAEQHVLTNANAALAVLANRSISTTAREEAFRDVIDRMADVRSIATFVLGRYGGSVRDDAALRAAWTDAFGGYAFAVYQEQLARYAGGQVRITGSIERVAGRDVIVRSEIPARSNGRPLLLQWRLLYGDVGWRVVDVSFVTDGSEIWLAQQQRNEFMLQLDQSRGDMRALITSVRARTVELRRQRSKG